MCITFQMPLVLYRMSPFPTQLQFYVIKLLYAQGDIFIECHRCYDVAKNAATAAIGFSVRTVRAYIRACDIFLNVTLPSIALVKTV